MLRLLQLGMMLMFGYLLWRIFRIMGRSTPRDERSIYDSSANEKKEFHDVKDAEFTDLKPSEKEKKPE